MSRGSTRPERLASQGADLNSRLCGVFPQRWSDILGWTLTIRQNLEGFKWLLLVLETNINRIRVRGYASRGEAVKAVAEIEQAKHPELDAVLVWVEDVNDLRAAYPNYYADTREFIAALNSALKKKGKA
jgi:hypothetical protein